MKIVIDIPEDVYRRLKDGSTNAGNTFHNTALESISNGVVLPKGHGRLIDASMLRSMYAINRANFNTVVGIQKWIDDAPTIIEADKGAENEDSN